MKILFVLPRMCGGGAERVVSVLANSLSGKEDVEIFTFIKGESFYPLSDRVKVSDCGIKRVKKGLLRKLSLLIRFPKVFIKTRRKIKRGGYDAVLSFLEEADLTLWLIRKTGVKFKWITSERNDPAKKSRVMRWLIKKAYAKSDLLVCQSQAVKDYYRGLPAEKKAVIYNPIDLSVLPERAAVPEKKVVAVGRLDEQKNFPMLIKAFSLLAESFSDYKLDIYGEGGERKNLQRLIDGLNAGGYITLCGADKNVLEKVAKAELFVMTSNYEGFPNALLEAAAMGLPCVCTDFSTGTAKEIIGEEYLVPVGDSAALKEKIEHLLSDKTALKKAAESNVVRTRAFDKNIIVKEWEGCLKAVAGKDE